MSKTPEERKAAKAAYQKKYYQDNKEKYQRYYQEKKEKIKEYNQTPKMVEWHANYYRQNRAQKDAYHKEYIRKHRTKINEQNRISRIIREGRPVQPKPYSFVRDMINAFCTLTKEQTQPIWTFILSLDLTDYQRDIVSLTMIGKTQVEISAIKNIQQSSISKLWNGNMDYVAKVRYGGVHKKFLKALTPAMEAYLDSLSLKWQ